MAVAVKHMIPWVLVLCAAVSKMAVATEPMPLIDPTGGGVARRLVAGIWVGPPMCAWPSRTWAERLSHPPCK